MRRRFRLLVRVFFERFFENDSVAPGSGFQTNVYQIAGFLVATGWFVSYFLMPEFLRLSVAKANAQTEWTLHTLRMFFTAYSFAIVGFASLFEWDMLFPDRRDFLALGTLPLRLTEILAARVAALLGFLLLMISAINVFPILMMIVLSVMVPSFHGAGAQMVVAQIAATSAASLFALLAVIALEGLLLAALPSHWFDRVSPWVQMFGMSAMVLSVFLYPMYALLLKSGLERQEIWPWLLPPVWFSGVYDLLLAPAQREFVRLAQHGLIVLGVAAVVAVVGWTLGYRRHYYGTIQVDGGARSVARSGWLAKLAGSPQALAIAEFSLRTLARSRKHRLFLATYVSVGLSFGLLFAVAVRSGELVLSREGVRAFPFLIVFFLVSGFRAVCQFPAELPANWIFRLLEAEWSEAARRATRIVAFGRVLLPVAVLLIGLELLVWPWPDVLLHGVVQLLAGALLVEVVFWTFDKVPFTCSYFSGSLNLSLLAGLYFYGFTTYSFHLAELERAMETSAAYTLVGFLAGGAGLRWLWRWPRVPTEVRFDAEEPVVRGLNLT